MNDLKNGIVDLEGFLLGPETPLQSAEEFFETMATELYEGSYLLKPQRSYMCGELEFEIKISFRPNIRSIKMRPIMADISAKYDLTSRSDDWLPYFKEIRDVLDKWLLKQVGVPFAKDEDVTEYHFKGNILISTCAYIERSKDIYINGGWLEIDFLPYSIKC